MGQSDRTRNRRKMANVIRLCDNIDKHVAEVGQQYADYQPAIEKACFQVTQITSTLKDFIKSIITQM